MEQLLLVTSCDSPAGIGASLRTDERTDRWTDRRDVGNSILEIYTDGNGQNFSIGLITSPDLKIGVFITLEIF